MPRGRRLDAAASRERVAWPWCIFDHAGFFLCRGKTRLEAIRRAERAEGRYHHRTLLIVKNARTGEKWVRLRGAWFRQVNGVAI